MAFPFASIVLSCTVLYALKLFIDVIKYERIKKRMPPGPPGLPVLGNLLQIGQFAFMRYAQWAQEYGPIFSLHLGSQPVVVLNDFVTSADLTDRRSAIYSDRPRLIMANELMTKELIMVLTPYGDLWRDMRKAAHEGFRADVVRDYRRLQEQAAYRLLNTLLEDSECRARPEGWAHHIESSLAWTSLSVIYGLTLSEARGREDIVQYVEDFGRRTGTAAMPGKFLIDVLPILKHLPHFVNRWKIMGEKSYQSDTHFLVGLLSEVRARMAAGVAPKSFCADLIEQGELTEIQAAWLCGTMYVAGVETVFVMAMVLYPEAMRRAQQELDSVVGRCRVPCFDDINDLPYVDALIREVMRWRSIGPLAIPKRCSEDDIYKGYLIPKGTIIIQNIWAMHRDPKYFEDPDVFRPERYLTPEGKLKDSIPDTHGYSHGTFGSGRRICVGRHLAQQSLFIYIATLLWGANISNFVDDQGHVITPSSDKLVDRGIVVLPAAFPCVIKPRFENGSLPAGICDVIDAYFGV